MIQKAYNKIRPYLPRKRGKYNGIEAKGPRLLDLTTTLPDYEDNLIALIRKSVSVGDSVTVVGGGLGISTIACYQKGASDITVYEPSRGRVNAIRYNLKLHGIDCATAYHAAVGKKLNVNGVSRGSWTESPKALPGGDVLILDCEGAELDILRQMHTDYGRIIVETHGEYGASKCDVIDELESMGGELCNVLEDNADAGIWTVEAVFDR